MREKPTFSDFRCNRRTARAARMAAVLAVFIALAAAGCDRTSGKGPPPQAGLSRGDISFHGMQLRPLGDGSYRVIGRLTNRSTQHTLHEVTLTFTMEDVAPAGAAAIVASRTVPLRYEVLPEKSAYFQERISFGSLARPKGRYEWNYSIATINGIVVLLPEKGHSR